MNFKGLGMKIFAWYGNEITKTRGFFSCFLFGGGMEAENGAFRGGSVFKGWSHEPRKLLIRQIRFRHPLSQRAMYSVFMASP